jgi:hypothetical protein
MELLVWRCSAAEDIGAVEDLTAAELLMLLEVTKDPRALNLR